MVAKPVDQVDQPPLGVGAVVDAGVRLLMAVQVFWVLCLSRWGWQLELGWSGRVVPVELVCRIQHHCKEIQQREKLIVQLDDTQL